GETFPIVLVTGVKLVGTSGAAATIIDATGANEVVIACFACASNTLVEGFTVTRGLIDFTGRIASTRGGGGIAGVFNCHAVFRRNIVTRNEARGGEGTGFSVYGGGVAVRAGAARFENNVIAYNIARGGSGQDGSAIQPVGGDGGDASGGGIWFEDAFDVQFVNNTVYGNVALAGSGGDSIPPNIGGRGGSAFGGGVGGTGYHAFNNIIVSNQTVAGPPGGPLLGPSGVSVDGGLYSFSASNTLHDNLFFHNQPNDANAPGVPAIFADPIFSSALTSDFHLSMLSPARGAGTPIGAPLRDLENTLRASPPTIGAYETGLLLTASPGIGRIVVTWPAVPGASSYNLYMSQTAGVTKSTFQKKVTGATSPYVLAPLPNNTTYYFVITAIENSVEGSISPEVSATSANGTWVKALAGMNFTAITTDMKNGMTLYAANDDLGVYKSSDGGDTWTNLPGTTGKIRGLAANGLTVFGAADTGDIFKSGNGGTSWATVASLGAQGEPVQSIAIDPLATNTIYTGDYPMGPYLFKSIDGGTSWNHLTSGALLAYVLQIDPVTAGTLWAAGTGTPNLSKSTDGGSTWSPAAGQDGSMSPAAGFVYALALAPSQPLTVYARITQLSSEPYGVHKTINGGLNWTLTSTGVPPTNPRYNALFVDPAEANRVHAGTELGYYTTTNGGSNWTAGPAGGPYPSSSLSFRAFAQTSNRRLLGTTNIPGALFMLALDPPPSISSVTPSSGSTIGGDSVTVGGSGFTIAAGLRVLFGGVDGVVSPGASSSTSIIVTTPANPFGTVDVVVINPDGQSAIRAGGFTYNCPVELSPAAANYSSAAASGSVQVSGPGGCAWTATSEGSFVTITGGASGNGSGTVSYSIAQNTSGLSRSTTLTIAGRSFVVTQSAAGVVTMTLIADASPSQVALSWTSTSGAISYEIQRSSNGGELAAISSTGATAYTDPTVASGTGYLYRIRAIGSGGEIAYSNIDLAVPFTYTYPSIVSGVTIIHAVDVMELRQAANAARGALGWAGFSFMDSILAGMTVKNIHIEQVRFVIDGVRSGAGLSGLTYADPSITTGVTLIRRAHITEARAGLQ
ncbi:MAG: IPT/TIG domain-containing protein, partial [Thermoanaerobaculia bacterium]